MDADADELARAELRELLIDSVPGPDWSLSESMFAHTFAADRATSGDLLPPPQVFGDTPAADGAAGDVHGLYDDRTGHETGTIDSGTIDDGTADDDWSVDGDVHSAGDAGDAGSDAHGEATGQVDGYTDGAVDLGGFEGHGSVW